LADTLKRNRLRKNKKVNEKIIRTQRLANSIRGNLPTSLKSNADELAGFLIDIEDKQFSQEQIQHQIQSNPLLEELIRVLSEQKNTTKDTLVQFGENNQFGDISIRDIVQGSIINLNLEKSRFSSISIEKQAEVFSSVYKLISYQNEIINKFSEFLKLCRNETGFARTVGQVVNGEYPKTIFDDFKRGRKNFEKAYNPQRVYIPKHIDRKIQEYKEVILWDIFLDIEKASSYDYILGHVQKVIHNKEYYADIILSDMHKFIGLNTDE